MKFLVIREHSASIARTPKRSTAFFTGEASRSSSARREWRALLLVGLVATIVILPIIIWGIPAGADLNNHYRFVLPFYESIREGNWHPGWLAESNAGFGDPRFRFYPPGLYYLLSAARAFTTWYSASLIGFVFLSALGGLGVYFWARAFCSPGIAVLAGVVYTVDPYRLNELYQASLLSEFAAGSILPFAFGFLERVCRKGKLADLAGLAGSYALVVLTHLPLTIIGSLALAVYAALRINRAHFWATSVRLVAAVLLGLAASAFFWTTIIAELGWIKGSAMEPNIYYDYRHNFLFSPSALTNRNTWYANLLGLAVIGLILPGVAKLKTIFVKKGRSGLGAIFILTLLSFLMTTELSRPLWAITPKLPEVQFPWRWLTITSMCGSIILAAGVPGFIELVRHRFRPRHLIFILGFVLGLVFTTYEVVWDCDYVPRQQFEARLPDIRGSVSFKDWLPIWARDVVHMERMNSNVQADSRSVRINTWQTEHRSFEIASGPATEARVRTYFYPHWRATVNGKQLTVRPAADWTLLISVPSEAVKIDLDFHEPLRVRSALITSAIAWILILGLLAFGPGRAALNILRRPIDA